MIIQNSKIVVIDDEYKDVKNLLITLNKNGTAFTYFRGEDLTELPEQPLKGVRLIFLDFVIGVKKPNPKDDISILMGVLRKTIAQDNGPYVILAWTLHDTPQDDHLALFKTEIMNSNDIPKPLAIINLEKSTCKDNLRKIAKKIRQKLGDKEIIALLMQWEGHAAKAAAGVLQTLSDISKPQQQAGERYNDYSSRWKSSIERHIYRISEAALGEKLKPDREMLIAAQMSLTELFRDQVESVIKNDTRAFSALIRRITTPTPPSRYSSMEKANMNSSFLLVTHDIDKTIQPGNIYRLSGILKKMKCAKKDCYLNRAKLTTSLVLSEFYGGGKKNLKNYAAKEPLAKRAIPVLMEITPECDYAQDKWGGPKMVLGVLWPESVPGDASAYNKIESKGQYIYKPLLLKYNGQIYRLTFNAHHIMSINSGVFEKVFPILKARKELLVDVQHWYARQISRPGKTEF